VVTINPSDGFSCVSNEQTDGSCNDYEVRYCCDPNDFNNGVVGNCPIGGEWTPWNNRDDPANTGDRERRHEYQPKGTCASAKTAPAAIQARLVSNKKPYQYGGDVVTINPSDGFSCVSNQQTDGRCNDYEVRYCCDINDYNDGIVGKCPNGSSWTPWNNRDRPEGSGDWEDRASYAFKSTCAHRTVPFAIQARLVWNKEPYQFGGNVVTINPSYGFRCENNKQMSGTRCDDYEVRYCC